MTLRVDLWQAPYTFSSVTAGATAQHVIPVEDINWQGTTKTLDLGFVQTKIFEVSIYNAASVGGAAGNNTDLAIYEDSSYSNIYQRVYAAGVDNSNGAVVFLFGDGLQYRDRSNAGTTTANFYVSVKNNTAVTADITVTISHVPFFARR